MSSLHTQLTQMNNILIQQSIQQAIEAMNELRQVLTHTIDSYTWRSDEYIENNIITLEEHELEVLMIKRKLDKIAQSI